MRIFIRVPALSSVLLLALVTLGSGCG